MNAKKTAKICSKFQGLTHIFDNNFKTVKDNSNLKKLELGEKFLYISGKFHSERFRDS